ncbi:hypothetical protein BS78_05G019800 [Paspalum vaginatum]|nr:hypothetical protein BS78_05G019800 [Paspalum vaginatum]
MVAVGAEPGVDAAEAAVVVEGATVAGVDAAEAAAAAADAVAAYVEEGATAERSVVVPMFEASPSTLLALAPPKAHAKTKSRTSVLLPSSPLRPGQSMPRLNPPHPPPPISIWLGEKGQGADAAD